MSRHGCCTCRRDVQDGFPGQTVVPAWSHQAELPKRPGERYSGPTDFAGARLPIFICPTCRTECPGPSAMMDQSNTFNQDKSPPAAVTYAASTQSHIRPTSTEEKSWSRRMGKFLRGVCTMVWHTLYRRFRRPSATSPPTPPAPVLC